jgi:hypothetical protein
VTACLDDSPSTCVLNVVSYRTGWLFHPSLADLLPGRLDLLNLRLPYLSTLTLLRPRRPSPAIECLLDIRPDVPPAPSPTEPSESSASRVKLLRPRGLLPCVDKSDRRGGMRRGLGRPDKARTGRLPRSPSSCCGRCVNCLAIVVVVDEIGSLRSLDGRRDGTLKCRDTDDPESEDILDAA